MGRCRLQFRIRTLVALVVVSALALGALRTLERDSGPGPGPSYRLASEVLAARRSRPNPATRTTGDLVPFFGALAIAFVVFRPRRS